MRNGIKQPVANKEVEKTMEVEIIKSKSSFSIDLILDDYIKLKKTNDDSKLASEAGKDCKLLYKSEN
jgi:hypothetical protein